MTDLLTETRVNFPSDKVTLNISDLVTNRFILWFNVFFKMNGKHHVDLLLEDSERKICIKKNVKEKDGKF